MNSLPTLPASAVPPLDGGCALFLDVDGTLLPIVGAPSLARPDAAQVGLLRELHRMLGGALALVSGRPLADLDRLYQPLRLAAAGQHGAELRDGAGRIVSATPPSESPLAAMREKIAVRFAGVPGILVEDKGLSIAIHYRRAPHCRAEVEDFVADLLAAAGSGLAPAGSDLAPVGEGLAPLGDGLVMQLGKMVCEIRPAGADKGGAIAALMRTLPFSGRKPVFVGDDVTDEDGFAMVNRLHGETIKVGAGVTRAKYRLADAPSVRSWLQRSLAGGFAGGEKA